MAVLADGPLGVRVATDATVLHQRMDGPPLETRGPGRAVVVRAPHLATQDDRLVLGRPSLNAHHTDFRSLTSLLVALSDGR